MLRDWQERLHRHGAAGAFYQTLPRVLIGYFDDMHHQVVQIHRVAEISWGTISCPGVTSQACVLRPQSFVHGIQGSCEQKMSSSSSRACEYRPHVFAGLIKALGSGSSGSPGKHGQDRLRIGKTSLDDTSSAKPLSRHRSLPNGLEVNVAAAARPLGAGAGPQPPVSGLRSQRSVAMGDSNADAILAAQALSKTKIAAAGCAHSPSSTVVQYHAGYLAD